MWTRDVWAASMDAAEGKTGSAAAMTRQPTGPDAGDLSGAAPRRNNSQLNRSMILQAALAIIDRDGVDGLSMRRLSDAVGRDPVMVYRHLPNKAPLLNGL